MKPSEGYHKSVTESQITGKQFDTSFNNLFGLIAQKTYNIHITDSLCRNQEAIDLFPIKWPIIRKTYHGHDAIMII